ncbi:hypothetical protein CAC42_266 [Sphaceloma murrayae]|uniref:Uncharacterized protein n=1 Tax=Sphaceloma murrayae TaxID=2082308 RepID=A0A2K1QNG0_9PEZI|nr:hypothetical protein CAC42_266 [Sphaceloma murrayae]
MFSTRQRHATPSTVHFNLLISNTPSEFFGSIHKRSCDAMKPLTTPYMRTARLFPSFRLGPKRPFSDHPPPLGSTRPSALSRLQSRLPPRLRPYLSPLLSAPVSHVTSFLILHEITALVPLAALFGVFHYSNAVWLERWRARVEESEGFREGVRRWGRYARRKGWVGEEEEGAVEGAVDGGVGAERREGVGEDEGDVRVQVLKRVEELEEGLGAMGGDRGEEGRVSKRIAADSQAGKGARVIVELATAYAITKVLLPARIVASVWVTPWFARVAVQPVSALARKIVRR